MQNKVKQNKEFCSLRTLNFSRRVVGTMQKPKSINELFKAGSKRLTDLKVKTQRRSVALEHVRAALPPQLAKAVVSAGIDAGQLTLGVAGAAWAARLRYLTDILRTRAGDAMGIEILTVRIKVVPPRT